MSTPIALRAQIGKFRQHECGKSRPAGHRTKSRALLRRPSTGPAAVRRPRVVKQGSVWIALLGPDVQSGIAGVGATIEAALAAFDRQYLNRLRPAAA